MSIGGRVHVAVGNVNLDLYLYVPRLPAGDDVVVVDEAHIGPGGAASNYSVAVARVGHKARLVAHTTKHAVSLGVLEKLASEGVDTSTVVVHEGGSPGMVVVLVLPSGEVSMIKLQGVNSLLRGEDVGKALPADVVHFASVSPDVVLGASSFVEEVGYVSYDPGGAVIEGYGRTVLDAARKTVDMLSVNARELEMLSGSRDVQSAAKLLGGRLRLVLVRIGGGGAYLVTQEGIYHVYGFVYGSTVDTTGAGDTFNAVFNAYVVEGHGFDVALAAASIAAGIKVTRRGAQSAPYRREIEEHLWSKIEVLVRRIA